MTDPGIAMRNRIQGKMTKDSGQKNRDLPAGDDLGQPHADDDMDGREQGVSAPP